MYLLFIILILAVCTDLKTFRIPNQIILTGYFTGFFYQLFHQLYDYLMYSQQKTETIALLGRVFWYPLAAFLIMLLLLPLFRFKVIGGGDVKLFSVCAMFTGFTSAISIILYALFTGAAISIFILAFRQIIKPRGKNHLIHFSIPILIGAAFHFMLGNEIWMCFMEIH